MRQELQPVTDKATGSNGALFPPETIQAATATTAVNVALEELLQALRAMQAGDFSARLPASQVGIVGKIADTFNEIIATNERMARQLEHVGEVVGRQGKTRQRVKLGLSHGAWGEMEASVNTLIDDLLWPTAEVTRAIAAVAKGDL